MCQTPLCEHWVGNWPPVPIPLNYMRCCRLVEFNSTVTLIPLFKLSDCSVCVTVLCFGIHLTYISLQIL